MDGGSNCHILIRKEYFISLHLKGIQCTLANGEKSQFQGIGLAIIEIQPFIFLTLVPAYLSCKDDVNTISPGALKRYSKCKEASHEALEHLKITTSKGQKLTLPTITVAGLDYLKTKAHHFKRPMKTKAERNMHWTVQPKFVFHSGQHPLPSQEQEQHVSNDDSQDDNGGKE